MSSGVGLDEPGDGSGLLPSDTPGCPTISSKYRIEFSESDITIPTALVTLFSYTGSGKLFGFVFMNDHKEVQTKLTIDSTEVVFDLKSEDIGNVQLQSPDLTSLVPETGGIMVADNDKTVALKLICPIVFTTSVKIEAKRTGSNDHTMLRSIVSLTKET